MKNDKSILHIFWLITLLHVSATAQPDTLLTVNQPAPPIKVEAWLKGQPVYEFQNGVVYVMEFGFISCGPCRVAIPHLTELARKYEGQVQVISVFVYENSKTTPGKAYVQKVKNFIEKQGDKIGYTVAVDDEQQTMARTWYEPAARAKLLGFPAVFIVDQSGKIVWIGPANEVEPVVEDIVGNRFDPNAAIVDQKQRNHVYRRIAQAQNKKEYNTAIHLIDSLITRHPMNELLCQQKFGILLQYDMNLALDYGRYLLSDRCHDNESVLYFMADKIISKNHLTEYKSFNELSDLVIYLTDRARVLSTSDLISSRLMFFQAQAYANKGMYKQACEKQELCLQYLEKEIRTNKGSSDHQSMLEMLGLYKKQAHLNSDF